MSKDECASIRSWSFKIKSNENWWQIGRATMRWSNDWDFFTNTCLVFALISERKKLNLYYHKISNNIKWFLNYYKTYMANMVLGIEILWKPFPFRIKGKNRISLKFFFLIERHMITWNEHRSINKNPSISMTIFGIK